MPDRKQLRQNGKEATRVRILDAARLHFERDGFDAASVRAIAAGANVAAGTVLLHFPDKLWLLNAALHDSLEDAIQSSLAAPRRGRLLTRLVAVVRPFFAFYAARPRLTKILLRGSLLADSPWRERFTAQVAKVHVHVAGIVTEAMDRGEIALATSANLFATALFSFYYFALIGWFQGGIADPMPLFKNLMAQHIKSAAPSAGRRNIL